MPIFLNGIQQGASGSGDVVGPSSSVDNAIARFNSTTGKLLQDYTSSAPTISDTGVVILNEGQLTFPSTENPSADANTIDDYEEGTWTPVLTFATAGNLSVVYSGQVGHYTKVARLVFLQFSLNTSTFTHTTASGAFQITGVPFTSANVSLLDTTGTCSWDGITKANYTYVVPFLPSNSTTLNMRAAGSAQNSTGLTATDFPTGGAPLGQGSLFYRV